MAHRGQGTSSQGTQLVVEEGLEPQHPTAIQRFILDRVSEHVIGNQYIKNVTDSL